MISTFIPVSDSFVVAGTVKSQVQILQFPDSEPPLENLHGHVTPATIEESVFSPVAIRPASTSVLGKCSHWPVNDIAHLEEHVAAVSASTLSTWDLVKTCRVRHLTTPDHSTACKYVGPRLLAVAGHGRLVHLYDTRMLHLALSPVWTVKVATDNLYAMAVDGCTVYTAGADGCIYGVDLRAHRRCRWDLQPGARGNCAQNDRSDSLNLPFVSKQKLTNAILDLKVLKDDFFLTLESGQVCGVPRQFPAKTKNHDLGENTTQNNTHDVSGGSFAFQEIYLPKPVRTRIGCDVIRENDVFHLAVGSEACSVSYYKYDPRSRRIFAREAVKLGEAVDMATTVRWAPRGLFASTSSSISLLPFSGSAT